MLTVQVRLTKELVKKAQGLVDRGLYSNKSEVVRDALRRLVFQENLMTEEQKRFTVAFSADLHGNKTQYEKLFRKALDERADALIIGGDIAPKDPANRTIAAQRLFFDKTLVPMIKKFNQENSKRGSSCRTYIMMGNDDFKPNMSFLKANEKKTGYTLIHNRCLKLHENFKILGYSYVPLTPFRYKDWEKLDLAEGNEAAEGRQFIAEGQKTKNNKFFDYRFDLTRREDTIEHDLRRLLSNTADKNVILVTHAPPFGTALDVIRGGKHVGSAAIRKIIEEKQPLATLHGHIHETVAASGKFKDTIGKAICMGAGNDEKSASIAVITFNIYNPAGARREII